MKRIFLFLSFLLVVSFLTSCYTLFKAERMVYAGSIAKRPHDVAIDSVYNVTPID